MIKSNEHSLWKGWVNLLNASVSASMGQTMVLKQLEEKAMPKPIRNATDVIDNTVVTTKTNHALRINGAAITHALNHAYDLRIPSNANIYFSVPGGDGWSSADLEIDNDSPIHIEWHTENFVEE